LRINHVCVFLQRAALDHRLINPFFSSEILGIPDENNAADDCWTNLCAGASSGQSRTSNNSPSPARVAEPANKPQTFKRKRILGDAAASPVAVQKQRLSHTQTNNQPPLLSDRETLQDGRLDGRLKCGCVSTCQTVIPMIPMEYKLLEDHAAGGDFGCCLSVRWCRCIDILLSSSPTSPGGYNWPEKLIPGIVQ
jgi:hypothetical protein